MHGCTGPPALEVSTYNGEYSWNLSKGYDTHMGDTSGQVRA
ncbi:hypothetical protein [Archangium minus]